MINYTSHFSLCYFLATATGLMFRAPKSCVYKFYFIDTYFDFKKVSGKEVSEIQCDKPGVALCGEMPV